MHGPDIVPIVFFLFLMICVVASAWKRKAVETIRHETIRKLIESGQTLDAATIKQLMDTMPQTKPGDGYRAMRVVGTILLFAAGGLECLFLCFIFIGGIKEMTPVVGVPFLVAMVGAGILFASRFMQRPPADGFAAASPDAKQEL